MSIDYTTKNTFTLADTEGFATYITGKGKTTLTVQETIYPVNRDYPFWEIHAGAADDTIDARASTLDARLYGDSGNDLIYGSRGYFNYLDGGDGNDTIDGRLVGSAEYYPTGDAAVIEGEASVSSDGVALRGSGLAILMGGAGSDTIYGSLAGEDFIDGGAGRDIIDAGGGGDLVVFDASDISVQGGGGFDTLDASSAAATNVRTGRGITIDLSSNRDIFSNFEAVIGSRYDDTLTGDNAANRFDGGEGNDAISAGGGDDFVAYDQKDTAVDGGFDYDTISAESSFVGMNLDMTTTHRNFENIIGSRFNDTIKGDTNFNDIYGGNGNDIIDGGVGRDYIDPGSGDDTWVYDPLDNVYETTDFYYFGGVDTIDASKSSGRVGIYLEYDYQGFENLVGSNRDDSLLGNKSDNVITGGAGEDYIDGGLDSVIGDTASYAGSAAAVTVNLGLGTAAGGDAAGDWLIGIENLIGSAHDDILTGSTESSWLEGGSGADQLEGWGGASTFASYAGSTTGVTANLADSSQNTGDAAGDTYINIKGLVGSSFNDVLTGDDQANVISDGMFSYASYYSGPRYHFGEGDDWVDGGAGDDLIKTGAGNDTVVYDAADTNVSDEGDFGLFGAFYNTIDTVDASSSSTGVTINLNTSYFGFENIIGSASADVLIGNSEDNVLEGGAQADYLDGGIDGFDAASYAGSSGAVIVNLGLGTASGEDAEGDIFVSIENLIGSVYADTLTGDSNDNTLEGGAGADAIDGGDSGSDTASYIGSLAAVTINLGTGSASGGDATGDTFTSIENVIGSGFNDVLTGGTGNNRLEGAQGADTLTGGSGRDSYVYKAVSHSVEGKSDTITGFQWGSGAGGDVIDCALALQANDHTDIIYYTTAFANFTLIKAEAQKQVSYGAEIFVATDGADTYVFMVSPDDDNYDAGKDALIKLAGVNDLTALSLDNFNTGNYTYLQVLG